MTRDAGRPGRTLVALGVVAALLVPACSSGDSATYTYRAATSVGSLIPADQRKAAGDLSGPLLSGGSTRLSSALGTIVVVNFWASWCPPCRIETPQFDLAYRSLKGHGVTFLGIDTKDNRTNGTSFVQDNHISYPMIFDPDGRAVLTLGNIPASLPFTVLIDAHGRVAAVYLGGLTVKDLQAPLAELRAES